jgi:hypothetical protein
MVQISAGVHHLGVLHVFCVFFVSACHVGVLVCFGMCDLLNVDISSGRLPF